MINLERQVADAPFLRRILLGLIAAACLSGAMAVALSALAGLTL